MVQTVSSQREADIRFSLSDEIVIYTNSNLKAFSQFNAFYLKLACEAQQITFVLTKKA